MYLIPNLGSATTEPCLPAAEDKPGELLSHTNPATAPTSLKVESNEGLKPTPALNPDPGEDEMETEEENPETIPTVKQETSHELLKSESGDTTEVQPSRKGSFKSPTSSTDKPELLSMNYTQERSLYQDSQSPNLVDSQEAVSAVDMEGSLPPQSEEEEDEEDDESIKRHGVDLKLHEVKSELLLDEMSSISHGDESSSGFLGSPGEPDLQLSMEPGLVPGSRSHGDNLLTETDDSLPFEPLRSDREKARRRGSPGRSRVKQVKLSRL